MGVTDTLELKAQCTRKKISLEELAKRIGINPATLHRKINGTSEFQQSEIQSIKRALELSDEQMIAIFFNTNYA